MPEVLQRLHSGAACVFYHQETRMYHVGIAFAGDSFQVAYYDRAGCVLSGLYNVHEHPGTLVRPIMGLSYLDDSYLGKDTSIVSRDGREFTTLGGVEIVECLSADSDILSKGTICWRCCMPGSSAQIVIKSKWRVFDPYRPKEVKLLQKATGIDGVAQLVCEDEVQHANGLPQDTLWLRDALQVPGRIAILRDHPRMELRRMAMRPFGRGLEDFVSKDELLGGFHDAIKDRGILHCDISDNNVMLRKPDEYFRSRGLLVDLDCAVFVDERTQMGPKGCSKGTHPFIACNVLNPARAEARAPWHDLESFLYVLMYICATCSGPCDTLREDFDIDDSPMGPWLAGDYEHKTRVMFGYDDAAFRAFLDELFDPYFNDLKDLVVDLRRVITRTPPFRAGHDEVCGVFERRMEARVAARGEGAAANSRKEGSPSEGSPSAGPSTGNSSAGATRGKPSAGSSAGSSSARPSASSKRKYASRDDHDGDGDSAGGQSPSRGCKDSSRPMPSIKDSRTSLSSSDDSREAALDSSPVRSSSSLRSSFSLLSSSSSDPFPSLDEFKRMPLTSQSGSAAVSSDGERDYGREEDKSRMFVQLITQPSKRRRVE
uniref:Fungal-type protein kinase domain-containing protein n=1 Tax=Schizophyllum commune (strain H4-8 / FGSC 9210) TaxID=578458 RepID=D8Q2U0_SCHCM